MNIIKKMPIKTLVPLCIFGSWLAATIVIIIYTMSSLQLNFNDINWSRISDRATMNIFKLYGTSSDKKKNVSEQIHQDTNQFTSNEGSESQEKIPNIVNTKDKSPENQEQLKNQPFSIDKFTEEDFTKSLDMGISPAAGQAQKVW